MRWDLLWQDIKDSQYMMPLMQLLALLVLITGLIRFKRLSINKYLVLHAAATLMQIIVLLMCYLDKLQSKTSVCTNITNYSQLIFLFIELTVCTLYISTHIMQLVLKKTVLILTTITALGILVFMIGAADMSNTLFYSFAIENTCITICCLIYFIDLMRQPSRGPLLQSSAFWAISAMLLLFAITTPLFIFYNALGHNYAFENVLFINYLLYCVLYVGYLKALRVAEKNLASPEKVF
jgi:hypothetical protein